MSFRVAIKAFWAALTNERVAVRMEELLKGSDRCSISNDVHDRDVQTQNEDKVTTNANVGRSEALELLASLQREARFVDFVKESLEGCDDSAIGAAARNVHDRCAAVLERCFEVRPLMEAQEGSSVSLSAEEAKNTSRVRLSRSVSGSGDSVKGNVVHAGWQAMKCSLPKWTGNPQDSLTLAPVEIEN